MVHPPIVQPLPDRSGAGRPRKSFTEKGRSAQHDEAVEVKAKVASHQFQAVLVATGLMAKEKDLGDLAFVLRRLAEDPHLATQVKQAITAPPVQGTDLDSLLN